MFRREIATHKQPLCSTKLRGDELLGFGLALVVLFAGDFAAFEQVVAEVGGGVAAFFGDSVALEHLAERGEDDPDVAPKGDFADIFEVVADFRFPGDGVAAVDLCQPAEALAHGVALALFVRHEDHVAHELRPRPDDGHVALEDVEEFGELVEAGGAEKLAVGVQALVVGEQVAARVLLVGHGAELDEPKDFLVQPGARLRKEGVALHLDCAKEGERDQQRAQAEDCESGAAEVKEALEMVGVQAV